LHALPLVTKVAATWCHAPGSSGVQMVSGIRSVEQSNLGAGARSPKTTKPSSTPESHPNKETMPLVGFTQVAKVRTGRSANGVAGLCPDTCKAPSQPPIAAPNGTYSAGGGVNAFRPHPGGAPLEELVAPEVLAPLPELEVLLMTPDVLPLASPEKDALVLASPALPDALLVLPLAPDDVLVLAPEVLEPDEVPASIPAVTSGSSSFKPRMLAHAVSAVAMAIAPIRFTERPGVSSPPRLRRFALELEAASIVPTRRHPCPQLAMRDRRSPRPSRRPDKVRSGRRVGGLAGSR
jgi:hypothetical protein